MAPVPRVPLWRRFRRFWGTDVAADVDDELRFHFEARAEELRARGVDAESAARIVREEFGDVGATRAALHDIGDRMERRRVRDAWWQTLQADLRYAVRGLRRAPTFTAVTVLSLALGIGATTTMFSVTAAIDLRPLPFPHAARLVMVHEVAPLGSPACGPTFGCRSILSTAAAADWSAQSRTLDAFGVLGFRPRRLLRGDETAPVRSADVSAGLFAALGTRPVLGRTLVASDSAAGSAPVVVIGHALWQSHFAGDPRVVGTQVSLIDDLTERTESFTVVGVMPPEFRILSTEAWTPLQSTGLYAPTHRDRRMVLGLGRLAPGRTLTEADAEARTIAARLAAAYPASNAGWSASVVPFRGTLQLQFRQLGTVGGQVGRSRFLLLGIVTLVLLVAAVNVAILFLVRASTREPELRVRNALGASRRRLAGQLLVEALCVAAAGGGLGIVLATWGVDVVGRGLLLDTAGIPIRVDRYVLGIAVALTVGTALAAGLLPAWRGARRALAGTLRAAGTGGEADQGRSWGRDLLVTCEVAAGLFLLTCAGVLGKELHRLQTVTPGIEAEGLYAADYALPRRERRDGTEQRQLADAAIARIQQLVSGATVAVKAMDPVPATPDGVRTPDRDTVRLLSHRVTPRFFHTLGTPIRRGRDFTTADQSGASPVAIVDATMAATFWPGTDPLGRTITYRDSATGTVTATVVGVVDPIAFGSRLTSTLFEPARPHVYRPLLQAAVPPTRIDMELYVRSSQPPASVLASLRTAMHDLTGRPVDQLAVQSQAARIGEELRQSRFNAVALMAFALFGLFLAALGLYGVVAYTVAARTREIGVRVALGADRARIVWWAARRGSVLTLLGLAAGVAGAVVGTRLLRAMVTVTSVTDPSVLLGSVGVLAVVAMAASVVPARRATRVSPASALRGE